MPYFKKLKLREKEMVFAKEENLERDKFYIYGTGI